MKRKTPPSPKTSPNKPSPRSPASRARRAAAAPRSKAPSASPSTKPAAKKAKTEPAPAPDAPTKQAQLITLLRGPAGASMEQMMALTGWQTHTVRGVLSGALRKRLGLDVQCQRVEGVHRYRIVEAAAA